MKSDIARPDPIIAGCFKPNDKMDPDFFEALRAADKNGVHIRAYDCLVINDAIKIDQPVRVVL